MAPVAGDEPIVIEYRLDDDELAELIAAITSSHRNAATVLMVIMIAIGVIIAVVAVLMRADATMAVTGLLIGAVLVGTGITTRLRVQGRILKMTKQDGRLVDLMAPHRAVIEPGAITLASPVRVSKCRWSLFSGFEVGSRILTLRLSDLQVVGIPTRALPDGVDPADLAQRMEAWRQSGAPPTDEPLAV